VRVAAQVALVGRMKAAHQDVADAEILLGLLRDTLAEWHRQRGLIVAALGE
jgi:hypothetical protein